MRPPNQEGREPSPKLLTCPWDGDFHLVPLSPFPFFPVISSPHLPSSLWYPPPPRHTGLVAEGHAQSRPVNSRCASLAVQLWLVLLAGTAAAASTSSSATPPLPPAGLWDSVLAQLLAWSNTHQMVDGAEAREG